ncbi:MAG: hypothetical protein JJ913_14075 [Rhizobiaceae bacterium]|nr:hypothetical protein [Rhizobiaceae bacterium]
MPDRKAGEARKPRREKPRGIIRAYRPADRDAVRDICRKTAYRNRGSDSVFEDGELFADYWTRYYTDFEPESCLVVEEDGAVIGYLVGCTDAARHERVMARRIVPGILARAFWRLATFRYRKSTTRRMLYWLVTRGWREQPELSLENYPAHYHCNILRQGYGKNYYTGMAVAFVDLMASRSVPGLHGQVEEAAQGGPWRRMVESYERDTGRPAYETSAEAISTFQEYVLGEKKRMLNRVWATSTPKYRDWLVWLSQKYRM